MGNAVYGAIRVTGALLVVFSCTGMGMFYGYEVQRRIREMKQLQSHLILLRGDVRYMRSSLPEAFAAAAGRGNDIWCAFFSTVADRLGSHEADDFATAFLQSMKLVREKSALKQQELVMLEEFGQMLGKMDYEMQMNAFEWFFEQEGELVNGLEKQADKKVLLSKSLGILAGVFLVIVMF